MYYLNEVKIIGRATGDAVVRNVGEDSKVASFRIVSNRKIKKRDGTKGEKATFVDVEVWGQRAEYAGLYVKRGTPVFVQGQLETDEWEKDGQRRSKLKIYGNSIQAEFPRDGSPKDSDAKQESQTPQTAKNDDDIPF